MSQKNSKTEKKTPRAMPVETIVTRFKSAQQRQLLEKELKNTTKSKHTKPSKTLRPIMKTSERKSPRQRKVQNLNKKPEKVDKKVGDDTKIENKEYYPNKLKRKVLNARIFLAPKHSFKIICGTKSSNRRKLHVPQRDVKYIKEEDIHQPDLKPESPKQKAPSPELTIIDMVRIIEENETLDDEDLLEILTCPSPVWWEEPPDGYLEEPIISQPRREEKRTSIKEQLQDEQNIEQKLDKLEPNKNKNINEINLEDSMEININNKDETDLRDSIDISIDNRDKNFINKRCHLESLLGNIRNKVVKPLIKENLAKNELKSPKDTLHDVKPIEIKQDIKKSKVKTYSECTEEDLVEFRDDDILEHLENLEIPIETSLRKESIDEEASKLRRISTESDRSDKNMTEEYLDLSLLDDDDDKHEVGDENDIELKDVNFNKSELVTSLNTSSHCEEKLDTLDISDEILDISDIKSKIDEINHEIEQKDELTEFNEINEENLDINDRQNNEYVTVYKILNNEPIKETQNETNKQSIEQIDKRKDIKDNPDGKIDSYYKQCKKISISKTVSNDESDKNQDPSQNENKSIIISETDRVKYCFICSSIFDTENCNYCLRKSLKRKMEEYCDQCGSDVDCQDIERLSDND